MFNKDVSNWYGKSKHRGDLAYKDADKDFFKVLNLIESLKKNDSNNNDKVFMEENLYEELDVIDDKKEKNEITIKNIEVEKKKKVIENELSLMIKTLLKSINDFQCRLSIPTLQRRNSCPFLCSVIHGKLNISLNIKQNFQESPGKQKINKYYLKNDEFHSKINPFVPFPIRGLFIWKTFLKCSCYSFMGNNSNLNDISYSKEENTQFNQSGSNLSSTIKSGYGSHYIPTQLTNKTPSNQNSQDKTRSLISSMKNSQKIKILGFNLISDNIPQSLQTRIPGDWIFPNSLNGIKDVNTRSAPLHSFTQKQPLKSQLSNMNNFLFADDYDSAFIKLERIYKNLKEKKYIIEERDNNIRPEILFLNPVKLSNKFKKENSSSTPESFFGNVLNFVFYFPFFF
jgi:hypothetical protein